MMWRQPYCAKNAHHPEHVNEAERCVAQLTYVSFVRQSKRSANVPLTLTGKPNPAQITLSH